MTRHGLLTLAAVAAAILSAGCGAQQGDMTPPPPELMLADFTAPETPAGTDPAEWQVIIGGVVGGNSQATFEAGERWASFAGTIKLSALAPGIARVRAPYGKMDLGPYDGLEARVRGDGKNYRIYVKGTGADDWVLYLAPFEAPAGEWTNVRVPFSDFTALIGGVPNVLAAPANAEPVRSIGLMVVEQSEGPFQLDVQWVKAYRETDAAEAADTAEPEPAGAEPTGP